MSGYFCGWYYKCQSDRASLALIPALHTCGANTSASLQIITDQGHWNLPMPWPGGTVQRTSPYMALGQSLFSPYGINVDAVGPGCRVKGLLRFGPPTPIHGDIMGPFRFFPFLECRHRVFSMYHTVTGQLTVNERTYSFDPGWGYIEGDQGRSFPRHYAWTQCCFPGGSVMLSAAQVPLGPMRIPGVLGLVCFGYKEYRLATYSGAKVEQNTSRLLSVKQKDLLLTAELFDKNPHALRAPVQGKMDRTVHESLSCHARYRLTKGDTLLWSHESWQASFEYEYPAPAHDSVPPTDSPSS